MKQNQFSIKDTTLVVYRRNKSMSGNRNTDPTTTTITITLTGIARGRK
ncbi:hypothetical protein [Hufsiella ginkgonis]|uniref:Uncharacterized protein n=1 Tax=Hufsiella ginkgonis TaxID=2695274 RepID=A0A7K1XYH7_9SPHI|nr:hypothetical protein [Hufsiella ginkgonis]MXV16030.1 hypothetical protein [Hufsiella ginkgonis]